MKDAYMVPVADGVIYLLVRHPCYKRLQLVRREGSSEMAVAGFRSDAEGERFAEWLESVANRLPGGKALLPGEP